MLHHIENDYLFVTIESVGAEIRSLRNKETGEEYIWPMNPAVWASSAPVLFPAIGKIKGDVIHYDGQAYKMPKHGIIRHHEGLRFQEYSAASAGLILESNRETRIQYPFEFQFEVRYTLERRSLNMEFHITNQGTLPMPFICGGHTAYLCSLRDGKQLRDYYVEFSKELQALEASTLGDSGLLGDEKRSISLKDGRLYLSDTLFNRDALIFADLGINEVKLGRKEKGAILSLQFEGYPHLALWSKPAADYLCIEPWLGLPDHEESPLEVSLKPGHVLLGPKEKMRFSILTHIH